MKKLLLIAVTAFTILFAQAQVQCQANFSYTQSGTYTGFTDLSTINTFGSSLNYSVTWEWDFGDGTISTQQNPVYTYANNGIYTPCLTVLYFDSLMFNSCVSVSCDTLLIGNVLPCPGSAAISQNGSNFTVNMSGGVAPFLYSWSTGESTQSITASQSISGYCNVTDADSCVYTVSYSYIANPFQINWCDSTWFEPVFTEPIVGGMVGPFDLTLTGYISDSLNDVADTVSHTFTTFQTSMSITNYANIGSFPHSYTVNQILATDTVTICWASELYLNGLNTFPDTCGFVCEDWIFDMNTGFWAKMGSITLVGEINSDSKKLIKIIDILGRETFPKNNEILFYIYEDGTIDKRYIKE